MGLICKIFQKKEGVNEFVRSFHWKILHLNRKYLDVTIFKYCQRRLLKAKVCLFRALMIAYFVNSNESLWDDGHDKAVSIVVKRLRAHLIFIMLTIKWLPWWLDISFCWMQPTIFLCNYLNSFMPNDVFVELLINMINYVCTSHSLSMPVKFLQARERKEE